MTTTDLYLAGVGAYLPDRQTAEQAIAEGSYDAEAATADQVVSACVERELYPAEMAAIAGRQALEMAGQRTGQVRAVFHSYLNYQGAHFWDAAPYVAEHTVGSTVPAFDVRQSCNGALASLELGRRFIQDAGDSVLITTGDRFDNRWVNRWYGDQSVFGDGGTAAVLSGSGGFARLSSLVTLADNSLEAESRGGEFGEPDGVIDFEEQREKFHTGVVPMMEHYGRMEPLLHRCIGQALDEAGISSSDLSYAIPVVTTRWRVQIQLDRFLGMKPEQSTWEFGSTTGHMGSGDQLSGLHHLRGVGALSRGDRVLLLGGGTGFTLTAAVLEILED
jgi:3-oxoacyl-[acyl-carrier-protein] synthase-3